MLTHIALNIRSLSSPGDMATAITALVWVLGFRLLEELRMHEIEPKD